MGGAVTGGRVPPPAGTVVFGRAARRDDGERGAGTVLVLAVAAVVLVLALAVGALGSAQRARGSAQVAADLAALAGATAARQGADGCAVAADAARRNDAGLTGCEPEGGGVVSVRTSRSATGADAGPWSGLLGDAEAVARAGPRSRDASEVEW